MNLLKETEEILQIHGKSLQDIEGVCGDDFQVTWLDFVECIDVDYDEGYGFPNVAVDLKIFGQDWWIERHDYDGAEWWEYKEHPRKRASSLPIIKVSSFISPHDGYTLKEINEV